MAFPRNASPREPAFPKLRQPGQNRLDSERLKPPGFSRKKHEPATVPVRAFFRFLSEDVPFRGRFSGIFPCLTGQKAFSGTRADIKACRARHRKTACIPMKTATKEGSPQSSGKEALFCRIRFLAGTVSRFPPVPGLPHARRAAGQDRAGHFPLPGKRAACAIACPSGAIRRRKPAGSFLSRLPSGLHSDTDLRYKHGLLHPAGAANGKSTVPESGVNSPFRPGKRVSRKRAPV